MSVISLSFRDHVPAAKSPRVIAVAPRHRGRARFRVWGRISWFGQVGVITAVGLVASLSIVQKVDSRQVVLAHVQNELLVAQSSYAAAVSAITKNASPANLSTKLGNSNLVVPTAVSQILQVPLDQSLSVPSVKGGRETSRILHDSHVVAPSTTTATRTQLVSSAVRLSRPRVSK